MIVIECSAICKVKLKPLTNRHSTLSVQSVHSERYYALQVWNDSEFEYPLFQKQFSLNNRKQY